MNAAKDTDGMKIEIKSTGHRKIPIADILPNPHRDLKTNPIMPERVDDLIKSFEQTGFWDNIVVREHPTRESKFELAYGHNRLAALKDKRVVVETITIPVAKLTDWQMYAAMVSENELSGRVTPAIAIENVNVGCDMIEKALIKIGTEGTWEEFNKTVGRTVPTGTVRDHNDHGFEKVRLAFFNGEGLGRQFLTTFLPCGDMRAATIQEIVASRYGDQKAKVKAAEAERLIKEAEKAAQQGERERAKKLKAKAEKAEEEAKAATKNFSQDVLRKFSRARTATDFCKAARKIGIPKSHHAKAADHLVEEDINGERMIEVALDRWWRNTQEEERDPSPYNPNPNAVKKKKDEPDLLIGLQLEADIGQAYLLIQKAHKLIEPRAATMSANWVDATVEQLIQLMDEVKGLIDLIRKNKPNKRGHLHAVGRPAS